MKNRFLFLLAMTVGAVMMLNSCMEDELDVEGTKILGKWYYEKNEPGVIGEGETAVAYNKIVLCGEFKESGRGFLSLVLVNEHNNAIHPNDPFTNAYWANYVYELLDAHSIKVKLTANYLPTEKTEWDVTYVHGTSLQATYEGKLLDLQRITPEEDAQYQIWMRQLGFGFSDDDVEAYNINDKDINATNWRSQAGLYIYDGVGADVMDEKGRTGYTPVYFPWYKGGVVNTNLDPKFCDDITPENGWMWVLNLCGDRSIKNNNFFALYNKYSGTLRIFYYMPESFTSGDDHLWEVNMTSLMAQSSVFRYGLPMDMNIVNKAAMGQPAADFYVDYITPYVRQQAPDGKITPNAGWWAFDVDMSLYRPNDNSFAADQSISLQMRSWEEEHVSLTSAITGKLDGDLKLDQTKTRTIVTQKKGLFGFINDAVDAGKTAAAAIASAKSGDPESAIKNGLGFAKQGYSLYGALKDNKSSSTTVTDTLSRITGMFNAIVQADSETEGIIKTSKPVTGAASPTVPAKNFITADTHIGEGIWNLKTSPVVYYFNSAMNYRDYNLSFFDPSSVEVVLNPNLFPESDIEWAEVDAIAGVREDGTGNYREAFGIPNPEYPIGSWFMPFNVYGDKYFWGFDFFYNNDETFGMEYVHHKKKNGHRISGRSLDGEYFLEPSMAEEFPDLEVEVTVVVKLKSMDAPMVYSRSYIPVRKSLDIQGFEGFLDTYNQIFSAPKKNGKIERGPIYDYQLKRIWMLFKYAYPDLDFTVKTTSGDFDMSDALRNRYYNFSGLDISLKEEAKTGKWVLEWSYDKPAAPWAYEMTGSYDSDTDYVTGAPASWKLKAKLKKGDDWVLLDEQKDNTKWLLDDWRTSQTAQFDIKVKNQPWQYYRLEITKKATKSSLLTINTFKLLY